MIGIIGAMSVEVEGLKALVSDAKKENISGIEFVSGTIAGKGVVVAQCGIGKVFAAICAQTMILKYGVREIINTGVAGTLSTRVGILDFAVSESVVQHDMDTSAIGDEIGLISGINIVNIPASKRLCELATAVGREQGNKCESGVIASGDQFICDVNKKNFIRDTFDALACEMESAAIGHVCYVSGVEFVVIRCISDSATGDAEMEYPEMVAKAAIRSQRLVEGILERI